MGRGHISLPFVRVVGVITVVGGVVVMGRGQISLPFVRVVGVITVVVGVVVVTIS